MTEYDPKADLASGVFDIRATIADRQYPTDEVKVYFDEVLGVQIERTYENLETLANLGKADEYDALEKDFNKLIDSLRSEEYTVKVQGVSPRFKEDCISKSLVKFPYQRNFLGQDDGDNEFQRGLYHRGLIWLGMIKGIVDPNGREQSVIDEDVITWLRENLPEASQKRIDDKLDSLSGNTDIFRFAAQDADFLSKP